MQIGQGIQRTGDPPRGPCLLLALESFRRNARNNQPLHFLRWRRSIWLLSIILRKRFGLGNF